MEYYILAYCFAKGKRNFERRREWRMENGQLKAAPGQRNGKPSAAGRFVIAGNCQYSVGNDRMVSFAARPCAALCGGMHLLRNVRRVGDRTQPRKVQGRPVGIVGGG